MVLVKVWTTFLWQVACGWMFLGPFYFFSVIFTAFRFKSC